MRLEEVATNEKSHGTYSGVRFDEDTIKALSEFVSTKAIPNPVSPSDFHTTLLYSRKHLPNYRAQGKIDPPWIGIPKKFEKWKDGEKYILVLTYESPDLERRHKHLMKEHNATWDYNSYIPHVTLSYDVGEDFDHEKIDVPDFKLKITQEYQEDLDPDWGN